MHKHATTALAVVSAALLAVTGCSSDQATAPYAAQALHENHETPHETTKVSAAKSWADDKVHQWFEVEGAEDFSEFYSPFSLVESWEQGDDGEVILTVDSRITDGDRVYNENLGPANDLWLIAAVMLEQTESESPDLQAVTAVTSDGERSETFTRDHMEETRQAEQNVMR